MVKAECFYLALNVFEPALDLSNQDPLLPGVAKQYPPGKAVFHSLFQLTCASLLRLHFQCNCTIA